ncbi:MAG: type II secretion system protein GspN [Thermodesulfobacteriota bacterium]|nr:type II secretion system protein GspN [Thermodesulfobacteriota bacterium]
MSLLTKKRIWLGYALFVVILGGLFMYLSFPSDTICRYLQGVATRFAPAVALSVDSVRPSFPFGLKLEDTDVRLRERPDTHLFAADSFLIMPSVQALTLRRPAFRFDCQGLYGGEMQGVVAFKTFGLSGPLRSDVEIRSVQLGHHPHLEEWLPVALSGEMSGTLFYSGTQGDLINGSGQGDVSILDSRVRFSQPVLGMQSVHFERIDARMALNKQRISLETCDFFGEQLQGKASGTIDLKQTVDESRLDLKVTLEAFSGLSDDPGLFDVVGLFGQGMDEGNLTIFIRGTVSHPRISFT